MTRPVFHPCCDFLLDLQWGNLFEQLADEQSFRCKGCQVTVGRRDREQHHAAHRRDRERMRAQARELARREAANRLRKARQTA